ncbi:MAG TPA: pyruvate formate lyase-activating protein [Methanosarcinales archaeon]|nr:pyruvate formate lyase-activating protein [Methanosarcinales archaeon]
MQCIAIDVGAGTQDILVYDDKKSIEQCFKMVLPSRTVIMAERIRDATDQRKDIFLDGFTMGGGPCVRAIKDHLKSGMQVYSTETAAKTIYDDLDRVRSLGVAVLPDGVEADSGVIRIETMDIDIPAIRKMLGLFGMDMPETFAVAVQDHGESTESNRIFRFEHLKRLIRAGGDLQSFVYARETIPGYLTRMRAVAETLADFKLVLMDTGPAAIFGAVPDTVPVSGANGSPDPKIVLNIGNGHTLCAILMDECITGVFEHHTRQLNLKMLDTYIDKLADGTLTFEEIFESGGHGCYIGEIPDTMPQVIATGPNRYIAEQSRHNVTFAAPHGDMMLTGCFGLVKGLLALKGDR